MAPHPARLHVLIAREAPVGLVIRRGPAKEVCTLAWDRRDDTFFVAQWMKGRIYERRCDLSPDGKHWIYFAMNGHWDGEAKGAWTAIARAPWLKAEALFPKGDCWHGGGLFLDNSSYWMNDGYGHERLREHGTLRQDVNFTPPGFYGGECLTVYYNRLQRDGWKLTFFDDAPCSQRPTTFEKVLAKGWTLKKVCHAQVGPPHGKGVYWNEHALVNDEAELLPFPDWEWADWVDGEVVYATGGGLYRLAIHDFQRLGKPHLIHNFNDYHFESRQAPY